MHSAKPSRECILILMDANPNAIDSGLMDVVPSITLHKESYGRDPHTSRDKFARAVVRGLASVMDFFFAERYGHRAVVLETIAAVPGMVGGLLQHLKSLRFVRDDRGWIKTLLAEAENERMHLLIYSAISKPTAFERIAIMVVQFFFYHLYFLLYLITPATAHRVVGYFEEEAIHSYEHYLRLIEEGKHENIEAPQIAIDYWNLPQSARLKEVVQATIKDEMTHRDVNHRFADDRIGTRLWS
jgi:ubiquinol oxidase